MKHLGTIILLLALFSCKEDNSFIVKGKVLDKDSGIVRFSHIGENFFDAEIYELTDQTFYFKGEIDCPEEFFIQYKIENIPSRNELERYYFFIEPGSTTEIIFNPENVSESVLKGSKTGREYLLFSKTIYDEFDSKKEKLSSEYFNALEAEDKEQMKKIIEEAVLIDNLRQNWVLDYIWTNPKSYISAKLLHERQFRLDLDTVQKYFDRLDEGLIDSKYYTKIKSFLNIQIGKPFVDFELPDSSGTIHRLSSLAKNKLVLIDFWFRGCSACRIHNKELKQLYERYKSKGFEIVGVSGDDNKSDFIKTIEEDKMTWLNLLDINYRESVGSIYELNAYPYNILIDQNGLIVYKANDYENLESVVDSLMQIK